MSAIRALCLVTMTALLMGCATTAASTPIEVPEQPVTDDSGDDATPDQEPAEPEDRPAQVNVDFSYPEGWTSQFDQEINSMVLRHPSGAAISFTIWPVEQATPFQRVYDIWEDMEDAVEQGAPIEPGEPRTHTQDGVEATYMMSTLTAEGGQRITLMHVAYVSNEPRLGILISGIWPVSMQAEMLSALRQIAGSIRISVGDPQPEQAFLGLEPPRNCVIRMNTGF